MTNMDKYNARTISNKYVVYDVDNQKVTDLVGFEEYKGTPYDIVGPDGKYAYKILNWPIVCYPHYMFNIPKVIQIGTLEFYPSKYEFVRSGVVHYHSRTRTNSGIEFNYDTTWEWDQKEKKHTLSYEELEEFDKVHLRKREPWASTIMGESAKDHADKLIKSSKLTVKSGTSIEWHWCHLIAFSMASNQVAQSKDNLFCGSAALNYQMTNVELAVKEFIKKYKRTLLLEVKADIITNTHLATGIGYYITDIGSERRHAEYYSPTNITEFSDVKDQDTILQILESEFIHKPFSH
ncbi:hypothetical protein [Paenibacillus typhae]|uniref:Uncharacterized protein n=1 Tax=Paenibacillus typhae TaxID=1174501 RepID=A0A1G8Y263_9BACL|nr:hypothetical protein [Paenibacillus typhae]SDJ96813.1 hypothetical protein SAMN05216192_12819 [Paenibacillus typhae]